MKLRTFSYFQMNPISSTSSPYERHTSKQKNAGLKNQTFIRFGNIYRIQPMVAPEVSPPAVKIQVPYSVGPLLIITTVHTAQLFLLCILRFSYNNYILPAFERINVAITRKANFLLRANYF